MNHEEQIFLVMAYITIGYILKAHILFLAFTSCIYLEDINKMNKTMKEQICLVMAYIIIGYHLRAHILFLPLTSCIYLEDINKMNKTMRNKFVWL